MRILVTGALGFIGSHFVRYTLNNKSDVYVVALDINSIQKHQCRILDCLEDKDLEFVYCDLTRDASDVLENIDIVVNFAAKTFVDASIKNPTYFINTNVGIVLNLLEQVRLYNTPLFVQVSTDEVYGSILDSNHKEDAQLNPSNPYSASKAAADMLLLAYANTYNLRYLIVRPENNFGSFQHAQKLFPTIIRKAENEEKVPIYGDGGHLRRWLRVEDTCSAIWHLLEDDAHGIFNIGAEQELQNLELAKRILQILGRSENQIELTDDSRIRPGHDRRYAIDCTKLKKLGWQPKYNDIDANIEEVVRWYLDNPDWLCL